MAKVPSTKAIRLYQKDTGKFLWYESIDKKYSFRRVPAGIWGFYREDVLLDTDRFRTNLADRNDCRLMYTVTTGDSNVRNPRKV